MEVIKPDLSHRDKALIILQANILRLQDELQKAIDESIIYGSGGDRIDKTEKARNLKELLNNEEKKFMELLLDENMRTDLIFIKYD